MKNQQVLPLLLGGLLITCFVSCSAETQDPQAGAANLDSAQANSDSIPVTDQVDDSQGPSDSSGGSDSIDSSSTVQVPREESNRETSPSEEIASVDRSRVSDATTPAKGVEERKSSATALSKGDINFDDLKFDLEKDKPFDEVLITDELRGLDGRDVTLRGYILPSTLFSETNISQFVLVRDNQECCFGPGAALYDCVMVQMVEGNTTDFVTRPVTVAGRFVIDTESYRYPPGLSPNGATHMAVFRIEGLEVR
ncbi:DUF3299 domain-containing protein [Rhodopirellula sp.]|nr:DUF3299 domain-containing protein [Rhodopirellula sp.]MDB4679264.1 DUF3299 domain-containing protein [Rhodopirellula sp.]